MSSLAITAEHDRRNWILTWLTAMRAWAFLILLLVVFELWARVAYQSLLTAYLGTELVIAITMGCSPAVNGDVGIVVSEPFLAIV